MLTYFIDFTSLSDIKKLRIDHYITEGIEWELLIIQVKRLQYKSQIGLLFLSFSSSQMILSSPSNELTGG